MAARPAPRRAVAWLGVAGLTLLLSACVTRVVHLNARHNAQRAMREADRLMRHGYEDSARVRYAQAAAAARVVLESGMLDSEEQRRWTYLVGRAAAWSAECVAVSRVLGDALQSARLSVLEALDARIAFAACLLREGHVAEGREQLGLFTRARLDTLAGDQAHQARQRLTLWTMRLRLHEDADLAVDTMFRALGPAPHRWEPNAALYVTVQRERSVGPLVHAVREARDTATILAAIAHLDTATTPSARLGRLREGTDRLRLLLETIDPSGAAAYHAGAVALDRLGNPWVAVESWLEATGRHAESPLVPLLLWRAASTPIAPAAAARESLLVRFPDSPEAARVRGDSLVVDRQAERERDALLQSRWELMERALAEQRAARALEGG